MKVYYKILPFIRQITAAAYLLPIETVFLNTSFVFIEFWRVGAIRQGGHTWARHQYVSYQRGWWPGLPERCPPSVSLCNGSTRRARSPPSHHWAYTHSVQFAVSVNCSQVSAEPVKVKVIQLLDIHNTYWANTSSKIHPSGAFLKMMCMYFRTMWILVIK